MPRFVLLFHVCPPDYERASHWDFMLEAGDALRTWALAALPRDWHQAHRNTAKRCGTSPPLASGNTVEAEQLTDHRRTYLEYEGPVSAERGTVTRVESGTYAIVNDHANSLNFTVAGFGLHGRIALSRTEPQIARWLLTYQPNVP